MLYFFKIFILFFAIKTLQSKKRDVEFSIDKQRGVFGNPNWIKDREQNAFAKLEVDPELLTPDQPFHPSWEDYCSSYHCNDYHKRACGLNRKLKRFQWFQSGCHLMLNNQCAKHRGFIKYDLVDSQFCASYALHLRSECPAFCANTRQPVCGQSDEDGHYEVFTNYCHLQKTNCNSRNDVIVNVPWKKCGISYSIYNSLKKMKII